MGDDLFLTLMKLVRQDNPPGHILVEASGVADPRPITNIAVLHNDLTPDAVIVLADAELIEERADDQYVGDTVLQQLAAADLIIQNKCDLLDKYDQNEVTQWLVKRAPEAAIIPAHRAQVPVQLLLGLGGGTSTEILDHHHGHEDAFSSVSFLLGEALDEVRFLEAIATLPKSVLRAKGVVHFHQKTGRWIFQLVGRRHEISGAAKSGGIDRLVFLGTPDMPNEAELRNLIGI